MDVYAKLSRCDEFIPLARSERYFSTIRGRWCFLPSLPCMRIGSWQLPHAQMTTLATCIRKVCGFTTLLGCFWAIRGHRAQHV